MNKTDLINLKIGTTFSNAKAYDPKQFNTIWLDNGVPTLSNGPDRLEFSTTIFQEASANDGSISTTVYVTLVGDQFAFDLFGRINVSNLPSGLFESITRLSDTEVSISINGYADSHADINDTYITIQFLDSAFLNLQASQILNTNISNGFYINFNNPPTLYRSSDTFTEAVANDGSIGNTITFTLVGDYFNGTAGDLTSDVTVSNLPLGLTYTMTQTGPSEAEWSLNGWADSHTIVNDVANLHLVWKDSAFVNSPTAVLVSNYDQLFNIYFSN